MSNPASNLQHTGYRTWRLPGHAFAIHMRSAAAEDLEQRIPASPAPAAPEGERAAGVLVGRRDSRGDFYLEDSIPCRKRGASGNETPALSETIDRLKAEGHPPLGFYRQHNEGPIRLDDADLQVIRTWFTSPDSLILLLKPGAGGIEAGFFFWVDDTLGNQLLHPPVLFSSSSPQRAPIPVPAPAARSRPVSIGQSRLQPLFSRGALAAGAAVLVVLLILTLAIGISKVKQRDPFSPAAKPALAAHALGMRAEPQSGWLRVSWDRANPEILAAQRAVLEVNDGAFTERIELDRFQLDAASVVYQPKTSRISLCLTVFRKDRPSGSEVLRIVGYEPPPAARPHPDAGSAPAPAAEAPASAPALMSARPPRVSDSPPAVRERPAGQEAPAPPRELRLPPARRTPDTAIALSPPPPPAASRELPRGIRIAASPAVAPPPPLPEETPVAERSPLRTLAEGIARVGRGIGRFLAGAPESGDAPPAAPKPAAGSQPRSAR